jgi:hypothetical protein
MGNVLAERSPVVSVGSGVVSIAGELPRSNDGSQWRGALSAYGTGFLDRICPVLSFVIQEPLPGSTIPSERRMTMALRRNPIESETPGEDFIMPKEEALAFFEREIQRLMGMSGEEFIRRYDAGEYNDLEDIPETRNVLRASFLIPFGRQES